MENFAIYDTSAGKLKVVYEGDKILSIKWYFGESEVENHKTELTDRVIAQLEEYLKGERTQFDFAYELRGTDFQLKVWSALEKIPYGETRSYKEIATAIGNPKASRAVGMANNRNPMSIVVPCHRVVGANGKLVGYAGGLDVKVKLLNIESIKSKNLFK